MPPRKVTPKTPRMIDVAREAGVSRMAVSAVLMGTGQGGIRVAAETAERIRQIAAAIGYRPNPAAQQLAGKSSGTVAIVARDWGNFLAQRTLSWLHDATDEHGFRVLSARTTETLAPLEQFLQDLNSGWVDGVIYLAHENEEQWPETARRLAGVPGALTAIGDLQSPDVNAVVSDVTTGARATIEHLRDRRRQRIVFVTETLDQPAIQQRLTTYLAAARELGLPFNERHVVVETRGWMIGNAAYYPKFEGLARRLIDEFRCDAVICDSDFTALGLLRAFRRLGIFAPHDLSVTGWGDLQFSGSFDPSITTVSHNLPQLLARVVARVNTKSEPTSAHREVVPTRLVVRESS